MNTPTLLSEDSVTEYLCVDQFLVNFMDVQLINTALTSGLIDSLLVGAQPLSVLQQQLQTDVVGIRFLLDQLANADVLNYDGDCVSLTAAFSQALKFRQLMEVKIEFANFLAPDVMQHLTALVRSEQEFMAHSRLFELFDYQKAMHSSPENFIFTKRWVTLTTALTRHEAGACLAHYDFSGVRQLLDIGGNSGEFVRQIAKHYPQLTATVVDLPVVCEVGQQHLAATAEATRIAFFAANALEDSLPSNQDLVSFKSILHDWPEPATLQFLQRAWLSLNRGGKLLIFERAPIAPHKFTRVGFGNLATFLFFRSYRPAAVYANQLQATGFTDIAIQLITLETDFYLISAVKP